MTTAVGGNSNLKIRHPCKNIPRRYKLANGLGVDEAKSLNISARSSRVESGPPCGPTSDESSDETVIPPDLTDKTLCSVATLVALKAVAGTTDEYAHRYRHDSLAEVPITESLQYHASVDEAENLESADPAHKVRRESQAQNISSSAHGVAPITLSRNDPTIVAGYLPFEMKCDAVRGVAYRLPSDDPDNLVDCDAAEEPIVEEHLRPGHAHGHEENRSQTSNIFKNLKFSTAQGSAINSGGDGQTPLRIRLFSSDGVSDENSDKENHNQPRVVGYSSCDASGEYSDEEFYIPLRFREYSSDADSEGSDKENQAPLPSCDVSEEDFSKENANPWTSDFYESDNENGANRVRNWIRRVNDGSCLICDDVAHATEECPSKSDPENACQRYTERRAHPLADLELDGSRRFCSSNTDQDDTDDAVEINDLHENSRVVNEKFESCDEVDLSEDNMSGDEGDAEDEDDDDSDDSDSDDISTCPIVVNRVRSEEE